MKRLTLILEAATTSSYEFIIAVLRLNSWFALALMILGVRCTGRELESSSAFDGSIPPCENNTAVKCSSTSLTIPAGFLTHHRGEMFYDVSKTDIILHLKRNMHTYHRFCLLW
jgi:hypothetical protein